VNLIERSSDGTKMATSDGADIIIWDAATGNMIRKITPVNGSGSNGSVSSIAWHPNNKLLLVGRTNIVDVFDTSTDLSIATASPPGNVGSIDWNVDGSKFVVGISGGARIYDGVSGGLIRQIQMPNPTHSTIVAWSKSSNKLATLNGDRVSVWDNETGFETNHYQGSIPSNYNFQVVSPGSLTWNSTGDKLIFLIPDNEDIGVWSVVNPNLDLKIPIEIPNSSYAGGSGNFGEIKKSPIDSKTAIIVRKRYSDGSTFTAVRVWDASNGNFLTEFPIQDIDFFEFFPKVLTWSSDGQNLLVQAGNMIQAWNANTGARGMQLGFVTNGISSIHFNTDATQLLASANLPNNGFPYSFKGSLNLMNVPSGTALQSINTAQSINSVDWSKNTNQILAIFDYNGVLQIYTANSWNPLTTLTGYAPSVYSPDGVKLAVSQNDSTVRILNTSTGEILQTIAMKTCTGCGSYSTQSLAWSPDGSKIAATASNSPLQQVYDVTNGQLIWGKSYNYNSQDGLHWGPDGKNISYGSAFLDASTGDLVEVFDSSSLANVPGLPVVLAWSPNSRYVLTKIGNQIELRNAHSGRKILSLLEIPQQTYSYSSARVVADWNMQSNRIAVTDGNSSVYVYKFSQP
jgi:WD40 repeat protein